jgi:hypothetical protein
MSNPLVLRLRTEWKRWNAARRRAGGSYHRKPRPRLERLEGRALLASITEFPLPSEAGSVRQIVTGPDGNLWFTENYPVANKIGRITPTGQVSEFSVPTSGGNPWGITNGPAGSNTLWFTEEFGGKIGKITVPTAGSTSQPTITEFAISSKSSGQWPCLKTPFMLASNRQERREGRNRGREISAHFAHLDTCKHTRMGF